MKPTKERFLGKGQFEKGGYEYEKQEQENKYLNSILKEADKEFDVIWWKHLDTYNSKKQQCIQDFLHSQIELAYKAGQEEGYNNGYKAKHFLVGGDSDLYEIARKDHDNFIKQQTLKQIEEGLPKEKHFKNLTSEERLTAAINGRTIESKSEIKGYNKAIKDLKKFINTLCI